MCKVSAYLVLRWIMPGVRRISFWTITEAPIGLSLSYEYHLLDSESSENKQAAIDILKARVTLDMSESGVVVPYKEINDEQV